MESIFAVLAGVFAFTTVVLLVMRSGQTKQLDQAVGQTHSNDDKLEALRKELGAAKEELARKAKALDEARAEAKKKAKREGKKMQREDQVSETDNTPSTGASEEVAQLKKAIAGLEQQIKELQKEASKGADEAREAARADLQKELDKARDETKAVRQTLDELRESVRKKAEERPDVPGSSVDLKSLPAEAVQELARYFRKAEEYERLYSVTTGRLQLSQERNQELQKRYFAVCRELAIAAGNDGGDDASARRVAESLVDKTDEAATAAPVAAEATADDGAPKKKKRRRRRKKKKPTGEGAEAAADGADSDDAGDDGDDDGDEAESGGQAAASAPAASEPVAEAAAPVDEAPKAEAAPEA